MKAIKIFLLIFSCLLFFYCDGLTEIEPPGNNSGQDEDDGKNNLPDDNDKKNNPASDVPGKSPDRDPLVPISVYARYNATYIMVPSPVSPRQTFTFGSPQVSGYELDDTAAYNQITLHNVQLNNLIEQTPVKTRVTGTVAAYGVYEGTIYNCFSAPFDLSTTITSSPYKTIQFFDQKEFTLHYPENLEMPTTSNYFSNETLYADLDIPVSIPREAFESLYPFSGFYYDIPGLPDGPHFHTILELWGTDFVIPFTSYERHRLQSRDFHQYLYFTITYPHETSIFNIIPNSDIVQNFYHSKNDNSITVVLKYFNYPVSGTVISYIIAANGISEKKVFSIE